MASVWLIGFFLSLGILVGGLSVEENVFQCFDITQGMFEVKIVIIKYSPTSFLRNLSAYLCQCSVSETANIILIFYSPFHYQKSLSVEIRSSVKDIGADRVLEANGSLAHTKQKLKLNLWMLVGILHACQASSTLIYSMFSKQSETK